MRSEGKFIEHHCPGEVKGKTYLTDCCQRDEGVIDRNRVIPVLEICEEHGRKEDEDDDSGNQVERDLPNQTHSRRHPVAIC